MGLKTKTFQGIATPLLFLGAGKLTTIPTTGNAPAQATFKHTGTLGYWYITLNRTTGPTTISYSIKLGPGESRTEEDPPYGDIYAMADASANDYLSWYVGYTQ